MDILRAALSVRLLLLVSSTAEKLAQAVPFVADSQSAFRSSFGGCEEEFSERVEALRCEVDIRGEARERLLGRYVVDLLTLWSVLEDIKLRLQFQIIPSPRPPLAENHVDRIP